MTFVAQTGLERRHLLPMGAGRPELARCVGGPVDLVPGAADSDVYFSFGHTGANGVASISRQSPSEPVRIADGAAPYGLARAGSLLYFTELDSGSVMRWLPADDSTWRITFPVTSEEDDPRFVAVDEQAVYRATRRGLLRRSHL